MATSRQFPYQVALHMRQALQMFLCGGSLIKHNFVLSAAHCLDGFNRVTVIIGALNRINGPMALQTDVTGSHNFISHPRYNASSLAHDIALLRIPNARTSLLDHANVAVVDLPLPSDVFVDLIGRNATVSGWGVTSDGQTRQPSNVLRYITLNIISNVECIRTFGNFITPENLCVDTTNGRSPCVGRKNILLTFRQI